MSFETTAPTARAWTSNTLVETQANIHGVVTYLDSYDPKYASFELYSGQSCIPGTGILESVFEAAGTA